MEVTVITPSFNQGQFIERTLQSVASQACPGLKHVILDGGSSDETLEVLARFGGNIQWVSEPDRGQADAVNKGILATSSEVIGWLNSDDVYYPGALKRVIDFFERHPDIDVVYGMADHIDTADIPFEDYPTEPWNPERLWETCFICQPALFFRRRVVERYGVLDESLHFCMDYEYWLRLMRAGARFAYLPEKLAGSRLYPQTKTLGSTVAVHQEINDMLKRFGPVPDSWLQNYAYVVTKSRLGTGAASWRFTRELQARAMLASVRWNRRITKSLLQRLFPNVLGRT